MLHVDMVKLHVNIIMFNLHVDIIYFVCKGHKYPTIEALHLRDIECALLTINSLHSMVYPLPMYV